MQQFNDRYWCCERKIPYASEAQARTELRRIKSNRDCGGGKSKRQRVYRCPFCQWWHIGGKPSRSAKRRIRRSA